MPGSPYETTRFDSVQDSYGRTDADVEDVHLDWTQIDSTSGRLSSHAEVWFLADLRHRPVRRETKDLFKG